MEEHRALVLPGDGSGYRLPDFCAALVSSAGGTPGRHPPGDRALPAVARNRHAYRDPAETQGVRPRLTVTTDAKSDIEGADSRGGLLVLALLAFIAGAGAGLVGAVFRLALKQADHLRNTVLLWARGEQLVGFLLVTAASAAAVGVAAWMVRRFSPEASGSGIPHVEAVLRRELPEAPFRLIPIKFFGGLLAIGSGLALGREGPSVQMGASIGDLVGRLFRRSLQDRLVLLAAGAGAGLATAFNAPIAGAIFVLEELLQRFEPRIAIIALGVSSTAIAVARIFLGDAPDFHVAEFAYFHAGTRPLYFVLGAIA